MYDRTSPGLTLHLRYMHIQLDPSSTMYDGPPRPEDGTISSAPEGYHLGAQRTPKGPKARREFLWRPLCPGDYWKVPKGKTQITDAILTKTQDLVDKTKDMMLATGELFQPVYEAHPIDPAADGTAEIYSFPLWQRATAVYYQLACRLPYLAQVQSLALVYQAMEYKNKVDGSLREAMKDLHYRLLNAPVVSLGEAVMFAREHKKQADSHMTNTVALGTAVARYVHAITVLLPWFPSEYYMAPWEARLNGVGGLLVKCNINLAMVAMHALQNYGVAAQILGTISSLACLSNWEKAKILHLQSKCATHIQAACAKPLPDPIDQAAIFAAKRDTYLVTPLGQLADEPWIGDFSPERFSKHYLALRAECDLDHERSQIRPRARRRVEVEKPDSPMAKWHTSIKWYQVIQEQLEGAEDDAEGDLAANNALRRSGYGPMQDWKV